MTPEELTSIANVHQGVLTRHDNEMNGIRTSMRLAHSQHNDDLREVRAVLAEIARSQAQQQLNTQAIANLTANIEDLRTQVANFVLSN